MKRKQEKEMKRRAPKRTKIETSEHHELVLGGTRYFATIKESFVDSGKTKRILCKLDAASRQELGWQLEGAMSAIMAARRQEGE